MVEAFKRGTAARVYFHSDGSVRWAIGDLFVFFPQMFVLGDAVRPGLQAIRRALRAGGWVVAVALHAPGADLQEAVARLRGTLWAGEQRTPEEVAAMPTEARFESVRMSPPIADAITRPVMGQRPVA